jgi:3-hydroxyacyl-[acyl-carrier-protein] dehydratase
MTNGALKTGNFNELDGLGKSNSKAKLLLSKIFLSKQSSCTKRVKVSIQIPKESRWTISCFYRRSNFHTPDSRDTRYRPAVMWVTEAGDKLEETGQILYNSRFRMSDTTNVNAASNDAQPAAATGQAVPLDINQIQAILPHRYPFLLIDRVVEMERRKRIVAIKNVTINEPFFTGHFPSFPIMPGVLIVEAMAQTGGVLLLTEVEDRGNKLIVFTGIEKARFRRPVVPGDQLRIEVVTLSWKEGASRIAVRMEGKAYVNGKLVCDGTVSAQLVSMNRGRAASEAPAETTE